MTLRSVILKAFFAVAIVPTVLLTSCESTNDPSTTSAAKGTIYMNAETRSRIYSFDIKTGTGTNLVAGSDPFVTPEGTIICAANNGDLVEYSKDGTTKRVIVEQNEQQPFDVSYDDKFTSPQLSPD